MICVKCSAEIPENSNFCNICGAKQVVLARGTKKRGNGLGSAYKLPSGSWAAQITLGYYMQDGVKKRKIKRKKAFKSHLLTKKETKRKRNLRLSTTVDKTNNKTVKEMLVI